MRLKTCLILVLFLSIPLKYEERYWMTGIAGHIAALEGAYWYEVLRQ